MRRLYLKYIIPILVCAVIISDAFSAERKYELDIGLPGSFILHPHVNFHAYPINWLAVRARAEYVLIPDGDTSYGSQYYGFYGGLLFDPIRNKKNSVYLIGELGYARDKRGFDVNESLNPRIGLGYRYNGTGLTGDGLPIFIAELGYPFGDRWDYIDKNNTDKTANPYPLITIGIGFRW